MLGLNKQMESMKIITQISYQTYTFFENYPSNMREVNEGRCV